MGQSSPKDVGSSSSDGESTSIPITPRRRVSTRISRSNLSLLSSRSPVYSDYKAGPQEEGFRVSGRRNGSVKRRVTVLPIGSDSDSYYDGEETNHSYKINRNHTVRETALRTRKRIRRSLVVLDSEDVNNIDGRDISPKTDIETDADADDEAPGYVEDNPLSRDVLSKPMTVLDDGLPFSHPESVIWKGKGKTNFAVVVSSAPTSQRAANRSSLSTISQSRHNAIAGGGYTINRRLGDKRMSAFEETDDERFPSNNPSTLLSSVAIMPPRRRAKAKRQSREETNASVEDHSPLVNMTEPAEFDLEDHGILVPLSDSEEESDSDADESEFEQSEEEHAGDDDSHPKKRLKTAQPKEASTEKEKDENLDEEPRHDSGMAWEKRDFNKPATSTRPKASTNAGANFTFKLGYQPGFAPISTVEGIISDMVKTGIQKLDGLKDVFDSKRVWRVGTMCSGTESPIIFMQLVNKYLQVNEPDCRFDFEHVWSFEIVEFKQAYIHTNFSPKRLFRDVRDCREPLKKEDGGKMMALTAYGAREEVEGDLDMVIAGTCCVDFSNLNTKRLDIQGGGESGDTFLCLLRYCEVKRPKVVILENVETAPWLMKTKKATDSGEDEPTARKKQKDKPANVAVPHKDGHASSFEEAFINIGYVSQLTVLDSKDFYIPQTRNRGYMIFIDASFLGNNMDNKKFRAPDGYGTCWKNAVNTVKRPASVPFDAFLMDHNDARLTEVAPPEKKDSASSDWTRCSQRHQEARETLKVGHLHPVTDWQFGGACILPDNFSPILATLGERVLDFLEISHLRGVKRGYDENYMSRFPDISQNIDINSGVDTISSGITGCITPSGYAVSTFRNRPLIWLEAISGQAIDAGEVDFNRMDDRQIRDLAGNAMTMSVVGAAIFGVLSVFSRPFLRKPTAPRAQLDFPQDKEVLPGGGPLKSNTLQTFRPRTVLSPQEAKTLAGETSVLCMCEGSTVSKSKEFKRCKSCGHTSCVKCGRKPTHDYTSIPDEEIASRKDPSILEEKLLAFLPMKILLEPLADTFSGLSKAKPETLYDFDQTTTSPKGKSRSAKGKSRVKTTAKKQLSGSELDTLSESEPGGNKFCPEAIVKEDWSEAIQKAFQAQLIFCKITRGKTWTVTYESKYSKLVLEMSKEYVQWSLYAKVEDHVPVGSSLRNLFLHPVARMQPSQDDFFAGSWSFWLPEKHTFPITIKAGGSRVKSYEATLGMPGFDEEIHSEQVVTVPPHIYTEFDVDLNGTYRLKPNCGAPFETLHVKEGNNSQGPLYLVLDHDPIQDPAMNRFVFTQDLSKKTWPAKREVFGSLPPIGDQREACKQRALNPKGTKGTSTELSIFGKWKRFDELRFMDANVMSKDVIVYKHLVAGKPITIDKHSCHTTTAVFQCDGQLPDGISFPWKVGKWQKIDPSTSTALRLHGSWLYTQVLAQPSYLIEGPWQQYDDLHEPTRCTTCAPNPPRLLWVEGRKVTKGKKAKNASANNANKPKKQKLLPYEAPDMAGKFEKDLKNRPRGLECFGLAAAGKLKINISFGPKPLMHQAEASLIENGANTPVWTSYRLVTGDFAEPPKLQLLELPSCSKEDPVKRSQFPTWIPKETEPYPGQFKALGWMLKQERNPEPFTLEEVFESWLPMFGYRAEGKAETRVTVKGGIAAFPIGFGKTLVQLLLHATQFDRDEQEAEELAEDQETGVIPLRATFVFVPSHLTQQWKSEAIKFLGKKYEDKKQGNKIVERPVLVINKIDQLYKAKVGDFKKARLVLINYSLCGTDAYLKKMAEFTGMVEPEPNGSARAKATWYAAACERVRDHVKVCREDITRLWDTIQKAKQQAIQEAKEVSKLVVIPSRRLRGKAYQDDKDKAELSVPEFAQDSINKPNNKKRSIDDMEKENGKKDKPEDSPLKGLESIDNMPVLSLQIFRPARVSVDEFTYLEGKLAFAALIIQAIQTSSRWGLSGTPPMENFDEVKTIAKWVGINLGRDDEASMKAAQAKKLAKDFTSREIIMSQAQKPSSRWIYDRHQTAAKFLKHFTRQGKLDIANIECKSIIRLAFQSWPEHLFYQEMTQHLVASMLKFKKAKGKKSKLDMITTEIDRLSADCVDCESVLMALATIAPSCIDANNELEIDQASLTRRNQEYRDVQKTFVEHARKAEWLWHHNEIEDDKEAHFFAAWKSRLNKNGHGDDEVHKFMVDSIKKIQDRVKEDDWRRFYYKDGVKPNEQIKGAKIPLAEFPVGKYPKAPFLKKWTKSVHLRYVLDELSRLARLLVSTRRRSRLFSNVARGFELLGEPETGYQCDNCSVYFHPRNAKFGVACGHVYCGQSCMDSSKVSGYCPVKNCNASVYPYAVTNLQVLGTGSRGLGFIGKPFRESTQGMKYDDQKKTELQTRLKDRKLDANGLKPELVLRLKEDDEVQAKEFAKNANKPIRHFQGKKVEEVVKLVHAIQEKGEHALIFIQFDHLIDRMKHGLNVAGIGSESIKDDSTAAETLSRWQNDKKVTPALILKMGAASASGSNLTRANHVIFLHPYHVKDVGAQVRYESNKAQAIGRANRIGQEKVVYVYEFLTARTIDVDIVELRSNQILDTVNNNIGGPGQAPDCVDAYLSPRVGKEMRGPYASNVAAKLFDRDP